jgi:hypothetical protein
MKYGEPRKLHYFRNEIGVVYCHAEEEIPENLWWDFKSWMEENELPRYEVEGVDGRVYRPQDVAAYMKLQGIEYTEIIEDEGRILREIIKGKSKLEIMD